MRTEVSDGQQSAQCVLGGGHSWCSVDVLGPVALLLGTGSVANGVPDLLRVLHPPTFVPGGIPEQKTPARGSETRLLVEMDDPESHFHIYHTSSHVLCGEEKTAPQLKNEYK